MQGILALRGLGVTIIMLMISGSYLYAQHIDEASENARARQLSRGIFEATPVLIPPRDPFSMHFQMTGAYAGAALKNATYEDLEPRRNTTYQGHLVAGFRLPVADIYTAHLSVWAGGVPAGSESILGLSKSYDTTSFGFALSPAVGQVFEIYLPFGVQRVQGSLAGKIFYSEQNSRIKADGTLAFAGLGLRHSRSGIFFEFLGAKKSFHLEISTGDSKREIRSESGQEADFVYSSQLGFQLPWNISVLTGGTREQRTPWILFASLSFGMSL